MSMHILSRIANVIGLGGNEKLVLAVAEGIGGAWAYHLIEPRKSKVRSLCGQPVLDSGVPLSAWGISGQLREQWCSACEAANAALPEPVVLGIGPGGRSPKLGGPIISARAGD